MNRYDCMFGSIDKAATFIIESCCSDCYCCPFYGSIPCSHNFGIDLSDDFKKTLKEWLTEDCDCDSCKAGDE